MISKPLYKQGLLQMEFIKVSQQANKLNGEFSEASLLVKKSQQSLKEAKYQKVELRSYHRDLIDKLNSTEAKLIEIRYENERLLAKSNRTMIKFFTVSGVIKVINVNTIGASITPGMSILEVVPTDGVLMIESKVRATRCSSFETR